MNDPCLFPFPVYALVDFTIFRPWRPVHSVLNAIWRGEDASNVNLGAAQSDLLRKRSAFTITDTELILIAALAIMGLNKRPSHG